MNNAADRHDLQELYREVILHHARTPRNFRCPENATHTAEGINPMCGDKLRLYLVIDANERVVDAGFEGSGCAISMASASMLTEAVRNLSVVEADACFSTMTRRLNQALPGCETPAALKLPGLQALDGVRAHPSRIKCATLAWHALHAALEHSQTVATSE